MNAGTQQHQIWVSPVFTPWQQFKRDPAFFLAQRLYERRTPIQPPPSASASLPPSSLPVSVVCISDTHNTQPEIPDGDLLLHAGDLTKYGSFEELQAQLTWLNSLPHQHKVVIAGNHDRLLDPDYVARFPDRICEGEGTSRADLNWGDITYLDGSSARLCFRNGRSLTVFGSPLTPAYGTFAFQYPDIRSVWPNMIPQDSDILLTHGPPKGHLDDGGKGCPQLLKDVCRARPRLAVFGHIHPGHGVERLEYDGIQRAYDGVMAGDKGLFAVLLMACQLIGERLWSAVTRRQERSCRTPRGTTLVNAAVVQGRNNEIHHPAVVVSI